MGWLVYFMGQIQKLNLLWHYHYENPIRLLHFTFPLKAVPNYGLISERPAPPRQLVAPQSDVSSRSLLLKWVPGSDGSSPIRYFTVQVRELPNGDWQTYSSSISHEATSSIIERYHEILD